MAEPSIPPDEELAALYATGALSEAQRAAVEARLEQGDSELAEMIGRYSRSTEALSEAADPIDPPPSIKSSLMARVRADVAANDEPFFFQLAQSAQWEEIGIVGARARTLFVDRERGIKTFLLRLEAGSEVPPHPHHAAEECYVIEGDIVTSGRRLGPGDYLRASAGTMHDATHTRNGCLLLITAGIDEHD